MLKPPSYSKVQKPLLHPPSYIQHKDIRFLITDTPSSNTISRYINEFKRWNVTDVVRCCKATYSPTILNEHGIKVHDWMFTDGDAPPNSVIDAWLNLVDLLFKDTTIKEIKKKEPCIAVHCVAGLGRAPLLVAIALIEEGMDPLDSIEYVRRHRRGSINQRQLKYLETYKRRRKRKQYRIKNELKCCIL
ncbi:protein-tyrosine phosphatase-like protein [Cokeromyces recurvatus]|uniref:protein-tyrosine phosphatase-like protein n=1 Tax=Cokeromyces recurvatus TaxID=90255 RepID=UPI00221F2B4E|nr:protein-tyrosine phosphatase-like protein [Cokeromyces recurvatus]KAI7898932.1 protein-tyrosine phosphatase-like protein [Cokeromyces recurvatus]